MRGRPNLYTSYEAESQLMPTRTKKVILGLFLVVAVLMPFDLPIIDQLPVVRFLGDNVWLRLGLSHEGSELSVDRLKLARFVGQLRTNVGAVHEDSL